MRCVMMEPGDDYLLDIIIILNYSIESDEL